MQYLCRKCLKVVGDDSIFAHSGLQLFYNGSQLNDSNNNHNNNNHIHILQSQWMQYLKNVLFMYFIHIELGDYILISFNNFYKKV